MGTCLPIRRPKSRSWPLNSAFDSGRLQFQVASAWFQTQRSAQGTAFEEGLELLARGFPAIDAAAPTAPQFQPGHEGTWRRPEAPRRREPSGRACWRFGYPSLPLATTFYVIDSDSPTRG